MQIYLFFNEGSKWYNIVADENFRKYADFADNDLFSREMCACVRALVHASEGQIFYLWGHF